jgi:hypothetical protein
LRRKRQNKNQLELALFKSIPTTSQIPGMPAPVETIDSDYISEPEDAAVCCPCCGNPDFVFGCHSRCSICGYMPGCSG